MKNTSNKDDSIDEKRKRKRKKRKIDPKTLEEITDEDASTEEEDQSPYRPGTSSMHTPYRKISTASVQQNSSELSRKMSTASQPGDRMTSSTSSRYANERVLPDGRRLSHIHEFILSKLPSGEAKEKYLKELIDFKSHDTVVQKSQTVVNRGLRKLSTSVCF
jgi:hypothetical protein